jgi:hypothetical protein
MLVAISARDFSIINAEDNSSMAFPWMHPLHLALWVLSTQSFYHQKDFFRVSSLFVGKMHFYELVSVDIHN